MRYTLLGVLLVAVSVLQIPTQAYNREPVPFLPPTGIFDQFTHGSSVESFEDAPVNAKIVSGPWVLHEWRPEHERFAQSFIQPGNEWRVPLFYFYGTAGLARQLRSTVDCNIGVNFNTLCTDGASFLRGSQYEIGNLYKNVATNIKRIIGDRQVCIHMEPDFYQYVGDSRQRNPLSKQEAWTIMNRWTQEIKNILPNACFILDISPWNPELKEWNAGFKNFTYGGLVGRSFPSDQQIDSLWFHQLSSRAEKRILVNTGYVPGGAAACYDFSWDPRTTLEDRWGDGVIGVLHTTCTPDELIHYTSIIQSYTNSPVPAVPESPILDGFQIRQDANCDSTTKGMSTNCRFSLPRESYQLPATGVFAVVLNKQGDIATQMGNSSPCVIQPFTLICTNIPISESVTPGQKEVVIHFPGVEWAANKGFVKVLEVRTVTANDLGDSLNCNSGIVPTWSTEDQTTACAFPISQDMNSNTINLQAEAGRRGESQCSVNPSFQPITALSIQSANSTILPQSAHGVSSGLERRVIQAGWQLEAVGDVNNDGYSDYIWRDSTNGAVVYWLMRNGSRIGGNYVAQVQVPGEDWQIVDVADINGDGFGDLIWVNYSAGSVAVWLLENGILSNGYFVVANKLTSYGIQSGWVLGGAGDISGDGKADLIWRNTVTHENFAWMSHANDAEFTSKQLASLKNPSLSLFDVHDISNDGIADFLFIEKQSGQIETQTLGSAGDTILSQQQLSFAVDIQSNYPVGVANIFGDELSILSKQTQGSFPVLECATIPLGENKGVYLVTFDGIQKGMVLRE